ncbi:MLP-like protein 34 [Cucurbita maxima]|uniref:MLP-like protein 34 n=1 Tax=Cucurbita maxima TaxID=3661 RepID=A0A6J1KF28_CUCMA|nr:MLP-like protein 34 [Cucurbita maxima]XP_022998719.1 MLP-like protein 34 [Cucurbita maxima]
MAQISQVCADVKIQSSADKFYGFFRHKMHHLPQIFSKKVHSFEFLEGNDFTPGSLMHWTYDIVGPTKTKVKVADVDEENKSITYEAVEGDILSQYTLFRSKFRASDDGENGGAIVNWSFEFEKANDNIPSPEAYLEFVSKISTVLDTYLAVN